MKPCLSVCTLFVLVALVGLGQTPARSWKDRGEFDLYERISKEASASQRLELLQTWVRLYPVTGFGQERQRAFLSAYGAAGQADEAFATARALLAGSPSDLSAIYAICYWAPRLKAPPQDAVTLVKKTSAKTLARLDELIPESSLHREMSSFFDSIETGKPAKTELRTSPDRKAERARMQQIAREALTWANAKDSN